MPEPAARLRPGSILFALLLLSPLCWIPGAGYGGIRLPLVLGLVTILLAQRAFLAARGRPVREGGAPLLLAASILLGVNLLSLAVAASPGEAAGPLLVLFAGVAVFAVARGGSVARGFAIEGVPILLSIVGLALAAIGVVQRMKGIAAVATEGNTNYSGALAGMLFPATAAFAFSGRGAARRALPALAAAALLVLLILTESRGGWVGAVAGTAVAGGALLWRRVPGAWMAAVAAALLVGLPLALQGRRQLSEARGTGVTVRLELWKGAFALLASRPLLGVGAGNFAREYPRVRSEAEFRASHEHAGTSFVEAEDAHSSWAQAAAETGVPGLLALLLVAYVAARLWRYYVKSAPEPGRAAYLAGLGGGAAAYLVAGLFNTITLHVSPTLLFWSFLGLIELEGGAGGRPRAGSPAVAFPLAGALAALFSTALAWVLAASDIEYGSGMSTPASDPAARAARLERAAQGRPAPWKARHELSFACAAMGRQAEALAAEREAVRLRPHFVGALTHLARMLLTWNGDEAEAERHLRHAAGIAPYYHLPHFNLGSLELRRNRVAEARAEFELSARCHPRHAPSHFSIGETYALVGDPEGALVHFRRAMAVGMTDVGAVLKRERPHLAADPRYAELYR